MAIDNSEYLELLKHPFWQRKRLEVFERDGFKCRKCTDQLTNLQVHHLYYKFDVMPWDYPDDAMITLCELCHLKAEFIKYLHRFGLIFLRKSDKLEVADTHEIIAMVTKRLENNFHSESAIRYMDDIKKLMSYG